MKIAERGREFYLLDGADELPVQVECRTARADAVFAVAMGLLFGVSTSFALRGAKADALVIAVPIMLVILLPLLLGGAHVLLCRTQYTFAADAVKCCRRGLLGRREWEEPLSAYRGVLMSQRPVGNGGTCYVLTLKHRERRARDILLYQSLSPAGRRLRQEHCARLLGVPAVTETADGLAERSPADLDKSVRQRVAEGSLEVAFDPASRPPGHGLTLSVGPDALVLRSHLGPLWTLLFGSFLSLGVGAMLSGGVGVQHALAAVWGWLHVTLLVAGAAGVGWRSLVVEELSVSPREVRRRLLFDGRTMAESSLPSDSIEEVVLVMPRSLQVGARVEAVADSGTVSFGTMLSKAQRRWVRDCIIAVISK